MAAVAQYGDVLRERPWATGKSPLQWASEEMKGDRELCMAAVVQNGLALGSVSKELRSDRQLCTAAIAQMRAETLGPNGGRYWPDAEIRRSLTYRNVPEDVIEDAMAQCERFTTQ